jgi:NADP-dependent 3-hydroxy acid dehydrogenase YdfG
MAMVLKGKIAVVHGAGGAIGGAVARAFAREGAKLFLSGRNLASVEAVAKDIVASAAKPRQLWSTRSMKPSSTSTPPMWPAAPGASTSS